MISQLKTVEWQPNPINANPGMVLLEEGEDASDTGNWRIDGSQPIQDFRQRGINDDVFWCSWSVQGPDREVERGRIADPDQVWRQQPCCKAVNWPER